MALKIQSVVTTALLIAVTIASQLAAQPVQITNGHQIGDTTVSIRVTYYGDGPTFIALHQNEVTSIRAVQSILPQSGGVLIELLHTGERRVTFRLSGSIHSFDPNRIFTENGIRRTLGETYTPDAHEEVRRFRQVILGYVGQQPIVALHNNTNNGYSARSYLDGGTESQNARAVSITEFDHDNFYFTTDSTYYNELRTTGYSVILQSLTPQDDGSFSVFSAAIGLSYVNVEAEHGATRVQIDMLERLLLR